MVLVLIRFCTRICSKDTHTPNTQHPLSFFIIIIIIFKCLSQPCSDTWKKNKNKNKRLPWMGPSRKKKTSIHTQTHTHTHPHTQFTIQIQSKVDGGKIFMWVVWLVHERGGGGVCHPDITKLIIIPSCTRLHRSCAALKVGQRDGMCLLLGAHFASNKNVLQTLIPWIVCGWMNTRAKTKSTKVYPLVIMVFFKNKFIYLYLNFSSSSSIIIINWDLKCGEYFPKKRRKK
jgi:hypothetical protein